MSLDRHLSQVAAAFPIRNEAAMAVSWINAGVSNVPGTGESRESLGDVRNNENAFAASFSKAINSSIAVGGSLKYLQQKLDITSSFTIGVDVGVMARIKKLVSVGAVAQNIGSIYRVDGGKEWTGGKSYDEKFPLLFKLGAAGHLFDDKLIPAVDFEKSDKMNARYRAGAEYWFVKKTSKEVPDEDEEGKMVTVVEDSAMGRTARRPGWKFTDIRSVHISSLLRIFQQVWNMRIWSDNRAHRQAIY